MNDNSVQIIDLIVLDKTTIKKITRVNLSRAVHFNDGDKNRTNIFIDSIFSICSSNDNNNQCLLLSRRSKLIFYLTVLTDETVEIEPFFINSMKDGKDDVLKYNTEEFVENFCSPHTFSCNSSKLTSSKSDYLLAAKKVSTWTNLPLDLTNIIIRF
jgi:hypothetical protein